MRPPSPHALLFLALALAATATGCLMRAKPGEQPLVGDVKITGNSALGEDDIVDKIALTKSGIRIGAKFGQRYPFEPDGVKGDVRLKIASMNGTIPNYAPEYEDCKKIAAEHHVPGFAHQANSSSAAIMALRRSHGDAVLGISLADHAGLLQSGVH